MFGKNLMRELIQYFRRLWPYAIALGVMSVFACIIVLTDRNPVEATGSIIAIGCFVIAALAFAVRGLVHSYISFYKSLSADKVNGSASLVSFIWVQILAFVIFISLTALFILGGVSMFAWKSVGQMFSAFATDWPYFLEFLFFLIITACTLYIIPTTEITVFRFNNHKKWPCVFSIIVGTLMLLLNFVLIIFEVQLLIHDTSTNMQGLWATTLTILTIATVVDIGFYLWMYRTLQNTFQELTRLDK